jgi:hypothetical protein
MIRSAKGQDISRSKTVHVSKIRESCMSLVRIVKTNSTRDDGILLLSHSAVATFLRKHSNIGEAALANEEQLVSSLIIRDCCFAYLLQPRLSRLLIRKDAHVFETHDGEILQPQKLVTYAAKYWFLHFDTQPEDGEKSNEVIRFLRSPNFQTCIQIQSLFVIGHFLQSFDPTTDQGVTTRRNLPKWLIKQEAAIHRQYQDFTSEWCEVLQRGLSNSFNGEVDRCLWGALGTASFLSKKQKPLLELSFPSSGCGWTGIYLPGSATIN